MWYFAWLLGLPLAAALAVLNGMWYELTEDADTRRALLTDVPSTPGSGEDGA
ncbi:MAG: Cytochrome bd ubiquinol oxidase subunit X [Paracidovorax wautersii]|uniref:Cytochrome bd ubiquinol oxidase subunit X n=1 Tax=Paracidovorax wautersii TaxID=1177982 RepID=A0A7V8JRM5_9BURK|nr:MAG: Cytochrome bd ubiquinol oxidase subunit X [Paracidovorax wautersii]